MEVADAQLKLRIPSILEKNENLLTLTAKEFEKGEMSGIHLFSQLPEIAIEGLEADINSLEEQLGYGPGTRTTGNTDDGDAGEFDRPAP